jgi:hypothetical protein
MSQLTNQSPMNADHIVQQPSQAKQSLRGTAMPVVLTTADLQRLIDWRAANPNAIVDVFAGSAR